MTLAEDLRDLSVFFDVDDFAVTATRQDDEDVSFPVIFDREHMVALGLGQGVADTQPVALARSHEVASCQVRAGTLLRIPAFGQHGWGSQEAWGGGPFRVRDLQPDGTGLIRLLLESV